VALEVGAGLQHFREKAAGQALDLRLFDRLQRVLADQSSNIPKPHHKIGQSIRFPLKSKPHLSLIPGHHELSNLSGLIDPFRENEMDGLADRLLECCEITVLGVVVGGGTGQWQGD
jgi:hypothetical protein